MRRAPSVAWMPRQVPQVHRLCSQWHLSCGQIVVPEMHWLLKTKICELVLQQGELAGLGL